jgi:hypothetical protein
MRKQTQFARQRLLQEQSAQFLNESELPFTVPLCLPTVDSDRFVARTGAIAATTIPRKV